MTIFGILWMLLIVICMFSSFENIAALTIISATIQCSNVLVLNGSGIGPQVITSIAFILTDDDDQKIDTILNVENQRQNLKELAEKYTSIRRKDYLEWRIRLEDEMTKAEEK